MTVIFIPSTTLNLGVDIQTAPIRVVCESAVDKVLIVDENRTRSLLLQDSNCEFEIPSDFHDGSPFGIFESISFESKDWSESLTVSEFRAYLESL